MTRKELDEHYKLLDFLHQAQEMQRHIQKKAEKEQNAEKAVLNEAARA